MGALLRSMPCANNSIFTASWNHVTSQAYGESSCPLSSDGRCHFTRKVSTSWTFQGVSIKTLTAASPDNFSRFSRVNVAHPSARVLLPESNHSSYWGLQSGFCVTLLKKLSLLKKAQVKSHFVRSHVGDSNLLNWKKVLWSDEMKTSLFGHQTIYPNGHERILSYKFWRRKKGFSLDIRCVRCVGWLVCHCKHICHCLHCLQWQMWLKLFCFWIYLPEFSCYI